jgi:fatty acid/phospholipid biosynthesis enzyme
LEKPVLKVHGRANKSSFLKALNSTKVSLQEQMLCSTAE